MTSIADILIPAFWTPGWPEALIVILAILLLFGGKKLPELARGLGKGMREFREGLKGTRKELEDSASYDETEYEVDEPEQQDDARQKDQAHSKS